MESGHWIEGKDGFFVFDSDTEVAVSYPSEGSDATFDFENESLWFDSRSRMIEMLIGKNLKNGAFADIGAGNGYQLSRLQNRLFSLRKVKSYMCEPSYSGCLNAKKRGVSNVYCGFVENFPIEQLDIQNIGLFDILEHIEEDRSFLSSLIQRLPKGSRIFITLPALKFLWSADDEVGGHFRRFNKSEANRLISGLPIKVIHSSYFFSYYVPFVYIFRVLLGKKKGDFQQNATKEKSLHKSANFGKLIFNLFDFLERAIVRWNMKIPFGTSYFMILEKPL